MSRKAKDFKAFPIRDDIVISQKTMCRISKNYRSNDEMIWEARCAFYANISGASSISEIALEIARIMRKLDIIRDDLEPAAFLVNRLYVALYGKRRDIIIPLRVQDFYSKDDGAERYRKANERYETFKPATKTRREVVIESIKEVLKQSAPDEWPMLYKAIDRRFGFDPMQTRGYTYKRVSIVLGISESEAKKTIRRSLDIIRKSGLASSLEPSGLFVVTPLRLTEESAIENLCLATSVYRSLKKRKINTVKDVLETLKGRRSIWFINDASLPKIKRELARRGFDVD